MRHLTAAEITAAEIIAGITSIIVITTIITREASGVAADGISGRDSSVAL